MSPIEILGDHTYRMVLLGTATIGLVSGALGSFAYLRKQSLISDVISHSALPGTLIAFLACVALGVDGRSMPALIIGAIVVGTIAVVVADTITRLSIIRIDAAMAIVLTLFFGVGMLLLRTITNGDYPGKGGISSYLFGNASVITVGDLITSLVVGGIALILTVVFWKEFALRTFDPDQSEVLGFGGRRVDLAMFTTIAIATVIGVKAVGLVLMVAFVVTPPAAARQWTSTLPSMVVCSAAIGAIGSGIGAYLSIVSGGWATGPLIVLTLFVIFVFSMLGAPNRSVITGWRRRRRTRRELLRRLESGTALAEGW